MKLYHGSNVKIEEIDLSKGRRGKDFGKGFYLSDDLNQARLMAKRVAERRGHGQPLITTYNFDESILSGDLLKVKIFADYTTEWAEFILKNRKNSSDVNIHDYDLVIGPIANDVVGIQLTRYLYGYIDINGLVENLKNIKPTIQYFFGTDKAIKYLKKDE